MFSLKSLKTERTIIVAPNCVGRSFQFSRNISLFLETTVLNGKNLARNLKIILDRQNYCM